jgi:hypothetical protein
MRREYVGACDEPQSETILLLPVLAMATTKIPTGISQELPFRLKVCDAQFLD